MAISGASTGRAAEFFVAYLLETYGAECHRVNGQYADIWCRVGDKIRMVEVKASSGPFVPFQKAKHKTYQFKTDSKKMGWYCFVAMDRQLVLMYPVEQIKSKTYRITPSEFNSENQRRTIEEFLES